MWWIFSMQLSTALWELWKLSFFCSDLSVTNNQFAVWCIVLLENESMRNDSTKEDVEIQQLKKQLSDERMKKEQVCCVNRYVVNRYVAHDRRFVTSSWGSWTVSLCVTLWDVVLYCYEWCCWVPKRLAQAFLPYSERSFQSAVMQHAKAVTAFLKRWEETWNHME